ncbi:MAG: hypothetical protein IJ025_07670 [Clostridia bacterium]|nr:hypothetical protein [Clostridia bacterium]
MAENKKAANDKTRQIFNIVFACIAVGAAVATLLMTPFGKRLLGKNEKETTTAIQQEQTAVSESTTQKPTIASTASKEYPSVSVPKPTEPQIDLYKNYTFFIDKSVFDYTENEGVTTLTGKENSNVIITVTPYKSISYTSLCTKTAKSHPKDEKQPELNTENLYSAYHSDTNGTTTTVYCVDDGNGGSIRIKLERPTGADEYDKHFEILVSMFKVK